MSTTIATDEVPDTRPATELQQGKLVQKLSPGLAHSLVQTQLAYLVVSLQEVGGTGIAGMEMDADIGARETVERFVPDMSYILDKSTITVTRRDALTSPITVAFEIASPDGRWRPRVAYKLERYLASGTVVVLIEPLKRTIEIHRSGCEATLLHHADDEFALAEMPGLRFTLRSLFSIPDR